MNREQKINQLPKDWKWVKLGEIVTVLGDGLHGTPAYSETGEYFFINGNNLSNEKIVIKENTKRVTVDEYEKYKKQLTDKTILVSINGTIGNVAFYNNEKVVLGKSTCYFNVIDNINKHYIGLLLKGRRFLKYANDTATGSTIKNVSLKSMREFELPLPSIETQHRIVSKIEELFSEIDKGIEEIKTAQQQLKIYRQAVLKWAFEGKLTNKDVAEGEVPKGWKLLKLKDITLDKEGLRRGPFGSAIKKSFFVPDGYKVYEQGNAINDDPYRGSYYVREDKYQELINFKVVPLDLIVSCSGVTLGRISEIPEDAKPGVINQALLRIRLKHDLILNSYFIKHFRAAFFQKKIFDQSQGTAMPNLVGIKDFKEIELMLPPIEEQQQIVQEIESRLSVCDKMEETITNSLKQAEALRQSILKKAFEGKPI